ncbi:MAG: error-prone DNA polymerase [Myxococcaceae bacterium]|nr:error-prone DNA polymerase [Myxococcaceae bacterium]
MTAFGEAVCVSNHAFLRGASHPEELVAQAKALGLSALALTEPDGLHGVVKAHLEAKTLGLELVTGASLTVRGFGRVVLLCETLEGYRGLCELISVSRLEQPKGEACLDWGRVAERPQGLFALFPDGGPAESLRPLVEAFPDRAFLGLCRTRAAGDELTLQRTLASARALGLPVVAHNDVHTHARQRQPLHDVLTAVRLGTPLEQCGERLFPNAERTLKGPEEMAELFGDLPEAVEQAGALLGRCRFRLDELRYEFSRETLPPGHTPQSFLESLTTQGLAFRYPGGVPEPVRAQLRKELTLVGALDYAGYFLALWDIVRFAREQGILCQGRGSAANSIICFLLGITSIDPVRMGLLFERFLSMERREPPDIDVDFEHQRREEVLQYVYRKHGRHHAGMVAEVICYRGRSAVREVGKALGLALDQVDRLAKTLELSDDVGARELQVAGLNPTDRRVELTVALARQLHGFPRHLSIHPGGFVITSERLSSLVPLENATMEARTVVQWDKDDLSALDILKVDLLGLGMLTVVRRCYELMAAHEGRSLGMATTPAEDPAVYDMLCEADAIGVFQIESRAQMNMLPRLKPRCFYDLVVEIAIIRPGPIVGDMVHPYLRRRNGEEPVSYPSKDVEEILKRTLGVPLFQEQAMKLAMVAAGFDAGQADRLRRALSHKQSAILLPKFREQFLAGCAARGYPDEIAARWFKQFDGFANYGFPESHSASFALIAYASSWQKRYHPAAFCAALLDAQPMGFYAPHTLVDDARRHGVEVRPVDVNTSSWNCTLELPELEYLSPEERPVARRESRPETWGLHGPALRLGLSLVKGLREESGKAIEAAREQGGPFGSLGELARRTRLPRHELARLALSGALQAIVPGRREALWALAALGPLDAGDLFFGLPMDDTQVPLRPPSQAERISADWETVGLSLEAHPVALLRESLRRQGAVTTEELKRARTGQRVRLGGLVIVRQRPPTAKGVTFLSVEDEAGLANLVVAPQRFEALRKEILATALVLAEGKVERQGKVVNLKVEHLEALRP